jgi:hypothetical protein
LPNPTTGRRFGHPVEPRQRGNSCSPCGVFFAERQADGIDESGVQRAGRAAARAAKGGRRRRPVCVVYVRAAGYSGYKSSMCRYIWCRRVGSRDGALCKKVGPLFGTQLFSREVVLVLFDNCFTHAALVRSRNCPPVDMTTDTCRHVSVELLIHHLRTVLQTRRSITRSLQDIIPLGAVDPSCIVALCLVGLPPIDTPTPRPCHPAHCVIVATGHDSNGYALR